MKKFVSLIWSSLAVCFLLSSCAGAAGAPVSQESAGTEDNEGGITKLVWYMSINSVAPDTEQVIAALNRYTREKIGVEIEYHVTADMDYQQKMPIYLNTGEYFDICFTSTWMANYPRYASQHAFLDIKDLLPLYARETYEFVPQVLWDGVTVGGGIYGVPSYKEMGWQGGILVNADMAQEYGVDLSSVKSIEDYEKVLDVIKGKSSMQGKYVIPVAGLSGHQGFVLTNPYESLAGDQALPGAFRVERYGNYTEQGDEVFNQYATPEYKRYCQMARRWYLNGYMPSDPIKYDNDSAVRDLDFKSGKLFSYLSSYSPGSAEALANRTGHGVVFLPLMTPLFETRNSMSGILAVSAKSEHPEKALEFINLLNTDRYVGTLIRHGIEGIHYTAVGDGRVDKTMGGAVPDGEGGYDYTYGWQFGSPFNQKWDISYPEDIVDLFRIYNQSAIRSPHLGFTFNTARVDKTAAVISNVVDEYTPVLEAGMVEPDKGIPEFLEALGDSGVEILMREIRSQLQSYEEQKDEIIRYKRLQ